MCNFEKNYGYFSDFQNNRGVLDGNNTFSSKILQISHCDMHYSYVTRDYFLLAFLIMVCLKMVNGKVIISRVTKNLLHKALSERLVDLKTSGFSFEIVLLNYKFNILHT